MKITDLKCAVIGSNPVVRITTDAGIDGYGQAETSKRYLKPHIMFYRDRIIGQDPRDVARVGQPGHGAFLPDGRYFPDWIRGIVPASDGVEEHPFRCAVWLAILCTLSAPGQPGYEGGTRISSQLIKITNILSSLQLLLCGFGMSDT